MVLGDFGLVLREIYGDVIENLLNDEWCTLESVFSRKRFLETLERKINKR